MALTNHPTTTHRDAATRLILAAAADSHGMVGDTIDEGLFLDYRQESRNGMTRATTSRRALIELAEALYSTGVYVDLHELVARFDTADAAIAARALAVALVGTDPAVEAREGLRWTDENTTIGVLTSLRRLARVFGAR